nr:LOW QUALITY PROTEIN: sesquithujene synthase A-like [Setaria viridis]
MATPSARHSSKAEELRKATTFHPSLWGDFFLTYQPPTAPQHACMKERAEVLREHVRNMVKGSTELPETLNLIITLQRLGLDYYYENEIDKLLQDVYNSDYNDKDLNLVSLRFYLLRKNNYDVSSDVFLNFKSKEGNFSDADTRSLLSLYNAAYLRKHGEKILDEAISFTRRCLQDIVEHSESPLAKEVSFSLRTPLFRRVGILEAINYIPTYEKEVTRNEAILEFAKLNFNLQQLVFCEELKHCTVWNESAVPLLPEYMKGFYLFLLETFNSFEDELGPEKSYRVLYLKEAMKRLVLQYSKEAEWRDEDYVPETMSEHLQVSMESIGSVALACAAYVGMDDVITKDILEWVLSYPQFLTSFGIFVRLSNDLVSTKREQTADHSASTVHCYMKEHGTTMNDACEKIKELTEDSWKDMLEQCLALKELPKVVPRTVFDFSRTTDNMYKNCDAFTSSQALKKMIELLYVEPIPE